MENIFLQIVNMSITASYVILFVMLARLLLKKSPKIFSYSLWLVVLFRLIFPFSFRSIFSLISINTQTIPRDIVYTQTPQINSGIRAIDSVVNNNLPAATVGASVNPMQIWITLATAIWVIGIITLVTYSVINTVRLSNKLKSARYVSDNIYITDNIDTAFVFGIINPKIYLPINLAESEMSYIIKHEQTHIKRFDHIIKFVSFVVVSIHWFNPLVWIGFYLMSEDMELSCDEKVIKELGSEIKKEYSESLLSLTTGRRIIGGSPLAFGGKNTKGRIKNILNYKKPKFWIITVGIIIVIVVSIGLLSNPKDDGSKAIINDVGDFQNTTEVNKVIENLAMEFIDDVIAMYDDSKEAWQDYNIIDNNITKLEKLVVLDNILEHPIEVWNLEFKLKLEDGSKVEAGNGVYKEGDWLTEDNGMGKRCLVFLMDENNTKFLGDFGHEEFDFDNLAKQEARVRVMLAHKGVLPKGAYEGNHVIVKFSLPTEGKIEMFLSQPVIQGDGGIWAVERWKDQNGIVHHAFPGIDIGRTDVRINERYEELQNQFDNGEDLSLGDPIEVTISFIHSTIRQIYLEKFQVEKTDLEVIAPATMEDFTGKPSEARGLGDNPMYI